MVKFGELTNQNPWWKYGKNFSRFDRHLSQLRQQKIQIERKKIQLKQDTIIVIRGCRQTGKTTYIKQNIANLVNIEIKPESIMYLSVDQLIKSRREFRNAIDSFLTRNIDKEEVYIFLDEITALKD
jgi:predicted AAA+ superfamily ATPase